MQSEKKIKTIQEEISFCRVPLGTDSIIYIAVTMFFVAELGALFLILNSNAKREEDKDSTRRDIFLPRCGNVQV